MIAGDSTSAYRAISRGQPMIMVPFTAHQLDMSLRLERLGCGVIVHPTIPIAATSFAASSSDDDDRGDDDDVHDGCKDVKDSGDHVDRDGDKSDGNGVSDGDVDAGVFDDENGAGDVDDGDGYEW